MKIKYNLLLVLANVLLALAVLFLSFSAASAREIYETWQTDPFPTVDIQQPTVGSKRWCNRWNQTTWLTNTAGSPLFRMKGVNTVLPYTAPEPFAGVTTIGGCAGFTPTPGFETNVGTDPNSPGGGHFMLSNSPMDGDHRVLQVRFGLTGHFRLSHNGHLPLYAASHPFCHAGVQSFVVGSSTLGKYRLQSIITEDPRADNPECGADGGSHQETGGLSDEFSMDLAPFNGVSAPKANYLLTQRVRPNPNAPTRLLVESLLYKVGDDGSTTQVMGNALAPASATMPTWYGKQASRFGIGGQAQPQWGFISLGDVYAEAHWQLAKTPPLIENKLWIAKATYDGTMVGPLGRTSPAPANANNSTPTWHLTQDGFPSAATFTAATTVTNIGSGTCNGVLSPGACDWSIATANNAAGLPHQKVTHRAVTPAYGFIPYVGFPAEAQLELDTSGTEFATDGNSGCGDYVQSLEAQQGNDDNANFAAPFLPVSSYVPSMVATAAIPTLDKINSLTVSGDFTPLMVSTLTRSCAANAGQFYFKVVLETPQTGTADRLIYYLRLYDSRVPNGFTSGAAFWSGSGAVVRSKSEWSVGDNVGFFPGSAYPGPTSAPFPVHKSGTISLAKTVKYRIDIADRIKSLIAAPGISGPDTNLANWRVVSVSFANAATGSARVKSKIANLNLYYSYN